MRKLKLQRGFRITDLVLIINFIEIAEKNTSKARQALVRPFILEHLIRERTRRRVHVSVC